jgi:hypothetical protein
VLRELVARAAPRVGAGTIDAGNSSMDDPRVADANRKRLRIRAIRVSWRSAYLKLVSAYSPELAARGLVELNRRALRLLAEERARGDLAMEPAIQETEREIREAS